MGSGHVGGGNGHFGSRPQSPGIDRDWSGVEITPMPYRALARRRTRQIFEGLSRGDASLAIAGLSDDVHHVFAGDHALGGERRSRAAVERWFGRLFELFDLQFDVREVFVSGPPWDLRVAVEWVALATPRIGPTYENHGAHVIRIRFGKAVSLHAYEDSQAVADACRVMAQAGIAAADADPITG